MASCKCINGHEFTTLAIEDDPTTNCLTLADESCPECGAEFEVLEIEWDHWEDDVI